MNYEELAGHHSPAPAAAPLLIVTLEVILSVSLSAVGRGRKQAFVQKFQVGLLVERRGRQLCFHCRRLVVRHESLQQHAKICRHIAHNNALLNKFANKIQLRKL
jgi:hypothetical protein